MWEPIASDGTRYPLTADITTIGREGCDILLADARVSRQHARIALKGEIPYITDLNSSNGTFVNGQRVYTDHPLHPGDAIQMGNTRLIVSGPGGAPPTTLMSGATLLMGEPSPGPAPAAPRRPSPAPPPMPAVGAPAEKPGQVQAIGIMALVDGILNILYSITGPIVMTTGLLGGALASLGICAPGLICLPGLVVFAYPLVLGILEIIYGVQLLGNPPRVNRPARYLAIMQIVNILFLQVLSVVAGILSLVWYNDEKILAYFYQLEH